MRHDGLATVLAFGLAATLAGIVSREVRRHRRSRDLHERLQVWENEGGQIPGATLGMPAAKPPADHPQSYSAPS